MLGIAPVVEDANLMHALEGTGWRAPLLGAVFAFKIFHGVFGQRGSGITSLLRTPVDQTVFTDIQVPRTGTTTPLIRLAFGNAFLKPVKTSLFLIAELLDVLEDVLFFLR